MLRSFGGHVATGAVDCCKEGGQVRRTKVHRATAPHSRYEVRHPTVVPRHRLEPAHHLVLQRLVPAVLLAGIHAGESRRVSLAAHSQTTDNFGVYCFVDVVVFLERYTCRITQCRPSTTRK